MDRAQLCEALGVSDSAITAWEKKGLPVVRRGRGRGSRSLYSFDAVRAWCARTGHGHALATLVARAARPDLAPAPSPAGEADLAPAPSPAGEVPPPPPEVAQLLASGVADPWGYLQARASREKTAAKQAELELLERLGTLVSVAGVERAQFEIWTTVRGRIQQLPRRLDAKLAVEPDPVMRLVIWDRELREFLTELSALFATEEGPST